MALLFMCSHVTTDAVMVLSSVRLATSLLRIATSLFLLISFHVILSEWGSDGIALRLVNRCDSPIWPAVVPNGDYPVVPADGGLFLSPGRSAQVNVPSVWSGRLWARTGCKFNSSTSALICRTGDCQRRFSCNRTAGDPPVTLVELSFLGPGQNYYDVSIVDGYNLPVAVTAVPSGRRECVIGGCVADPLTACPPELRVNGGDRVVACKSACLAFDLDEFCCRHVYRSDESCPPNLYSKLLKEACPFYRTHPFDLGDVVSCSARAYVITFCPPAFPGPFSYK